MASERHAGRSPGTTAPSRGVGRNAGAPVPGKRTLTEQLPLRAPIQTKLAMSAVGDASEQEADAIGHQLVAAMTDPTAPSVARPTADVRGASAPTPVLR